MNDSPELLAQYTALQLQVSEAEKQIHAIEKKKKGIASQYLFERSKSLFELNPELKSFGWNQYTPGFNDGDICSFTCNASDPTINGFEPDDCYDDDKKKPEKYDELRKQVKLFLSDFSEDKFAHWFGVEGATITVTRDKGVRVKSYDCGY